LWEKGKLPGKMIMNKRKIIHLVFWMAVLILFGIVGTSVAAEYEKVPILMVHGLGGNSSAWSEMKQYLRSQGYDDKLLYTIDMTDNLNLCSESHVSQISAKVEEIVAETGFKRIDVMGHSRGGLNLYNYMLFDDGVNRVRNWISLAGANNMRCSGLYGNPPSDPTPGSYTGYTSIYSLTDELVSPQVAIIEGARNISIENASHGTMIRNTEVFPYVIQALQGAGLNDGIAMLDPEGSPPSPPTGLRIITSAAGP
jgi:triacylglycerol lipase